MTAAMADGDLAVGDLAGAEVGLVGSVAGAVISEDSAGANLVEEVPDAIGRGREWTKRRA